MNSNGDYCSLTVRVLQLVTLGALAPRRLGVRPGSFLACGVLREVCKGVVVAFKTNPEWIRGSSVGGDSKGENTVSYVVVAFSILSTAPTEISTPSKECELRSNKSPRLLFTCGLSFPPFTCSNLVCLLACYCIFRLAYLFKLACLLGLPHLVHI